MKNLKSIIVCLSVLVLLGVTMTGCGGKSDEEKLEELNKRMENAESLEEIEALANQIEKLEEKIRSNVKTTKVELGKPITFWQKEDGVRKITEFQITFRDPKVDKSHPYQFGWANRPIAAKEGMKYFGIEADLKNLGPRAESTSWRAEVKVNNGYIYKLRYSIKDGNSGFMTSTETIEPGKSIIALFYIEIPEDTYPVEVFGELGGEWFMGEESFPSDIKFSIKLTQFKK